MSYFKAILELDGVSLIYVSGEVAGMEKGLNMLRWLCIGLLTTSTVLAAPKRETGNVKIYDSPWEISNTLRIPIPSAENSDPAKTEKSPPRIRHFR